MRIFRLKKQPDIVNKSKRLTKKECVDIIFRKGKKNDKDRKVHKLW